MKKPEIQPPKILDDIADVVLAYHPKPKSAGSKRRIEKATRLEKVALKQIPSQKDAAS